MVLGLYPRSDREIWLARAISRSAVLPCVNTPRFMVLLLHWHVPGRFQILLVETALSA